MSLKISVSKDSWNGYVDVVSGLKEWRLWVFLGFQDIKQRYARSMLGPLWLVMGLGATIIGIGFLYSQIMKTDPGVFLPFIAISLAAWNFLSGVLTDSTSIFQSQASLLKSISVPYSTLIYRCLVKHIIVLSHYFIAVIVTYIIAKYPVDWTVLSVLPGLLLLCMNLAWLSLVIGMLCARFRDMAQMVQYALQLAQFATPVIWMPSTVRPGSPYIAWNPINHMIELLRAPIFEHKIPVDSYLFMGGMLVGGVLFTLVVFDRFKRAINLWI